MQPTSLELELTGRDEELARLRSIANQRGGAAVVIGGEAGVGKTRLAEELVRSLEVAGWTSVRVRATHASSTIPFAAFASFAPDLAGASPLEVFRAIALAVGPASDAPHVVFVDDAHHLDEASAALVAHLSRGSASLVVTVRSGEGCPDAVTSLWKEAIAERLELQPLPRRQTIELIESKLGGPLEEVTAQRLWRWSGGNPLLVREILIAGRSGDALVERAGLWCWRGPVVVDPRLLELVDVRLAHLPAAVVAMLELLAVGEPLEVAFLGPHRHALPLAEAAELVVAVPDRRRRLVRFAHPLYGEVLRAALDPARSAALHLELAERLEATGARRRGDVLRLATWSLRAGRPPGDARLLLTAARQALAHGDHALSVRLTQAASDAGAGADAVVAEAEARYWAGRHDDVIAALDGLEWASLAPALVTTAAIVHASAAFWGRGEADVADAVLAAAEHRLGLEDDPRRFEVLAHHASLAFFSGRPEVALRAGGEVLSAPGAGPLARLRTMPGLLGSWGLRGQLGAAREGCDAAMPEALVRLDDLPELAGEIALGRCLAEVLAGELEPADAIATTVYDAAAADGANEFAPTWALFRGRIALARGALAGARRWLREAVAGLERHDPAALLAWAHALVALEAALSGDAPRGRAALAESYDARNRAVTVYAVEVAMAEAWVLRVEGRVGAARATVRRAAEEATAGGVVLPAAAAWHDLGRLGDPRAAVDPLTELVPSLEGPLAPAFRHHVVGLAEHDGALLDRAAAAFAGCGALLFAAEAAGAAATCHAASGRSADERASRASASALARRCDGAVTVESSCAGPLGSLTDREREVFELAARGMPDRTIAAELYVSVRTVGNHLAHIYAKLGVPGRGALAPLVPQPGT